MKVNKEILVFNPFKVGSSTLEEMINRTPNLRATKFHSYDQSQQKKIPPEKVSATILVYRDPIELYMSAFFEDCNKPSYPYYYGTNEDVLAASTDQLINHFNKFPWETYQWLNYEYYINQLNTLFNINKQEITNFMKSCEKYKVIKGDYLSKPIVCLLLKTKYLNQSVEIINQTLGTNIIKMEKHRAAENRWYNQKYIEFQEKMKQCIQ